MWNYSLGRSITKYSVRRCYISLAIILVLTSRNIQTVYSFQSFEYNPMFRRTGVQFIPMGMMARCRTNKNNLNSNRIRSTIILQTATASSSTTTTASALSSSTAVSLKHVEFSPPGISDEKVPAIFLHGLLGNKRNFATIGRSLSAQLQHQRRIYSLDLRNHGTPQKKSYSSISNVKCD